MNLNCCANARPKSLSWLYFINKGVGEIAKLYYGIPIEIEVPLFQLDKNFLTCKCHRSITFKNGRCDKSCWSCITIKVANSVLCEILALDNYLLRNILGRNLNWQYTMELR